MDFTLYHYVHCPFCIRVRMALGFLGIPYRSVVLPYDDEETPVRLCGKKMLPILAHPGGALNESLDIIKHVDVANRLGVAWPDSGFEALLDRIGGLVHPLAMPYWVWTPEFSSSARNYFIQKKSQKRGPFGELFRARRGLMEKATQGLVEVEAALGPFYRSPTFSFRDLLLAAHLWGLYVVPEFQFSPSLHRWLQAVRDLTHFDYHEDFAELY